MRRVPRNSLRGFGCSAGGIVGTTFVGKEAKQGLHGRVLGVTDKAGSHALLPNKPGLDQPLQMMRQGGGRHPKPLLHLANRQATTPGPDQGAVKTKPCRIAECFELVRCHFDIHGNNVGNAGRSVKHYFRDFRNSDAPLRRTLTLSGRRKPDLSLVQGSLARASMLGDALQSTIVAVDFASTCPVSRAHSHSIC